MASGGDAAAGGAAGAAAKPAGRLPNVLVTGTPGTGKTTLCKDLTKLGFRHINVGDVVRSEGFNAGRDEKFDTLIMEEEHEEQLVDFLAAETDKGGALIDFHSCDLFPEDWFDLVLVLRASNTHIFDRLKARGYNQTKIEENITAEIMGEVEAEAREAFPDAVQVLKNEDMDDLAQIQGRVKAWLAQWQKEHADDDEA